MGQRMKVERVGRVGCRSGSEVSTQITGLFHSNHHCVQFFILNYLKHFWECRTVFVLLTTINVQSNKTVKERERGRKT